MEPEACARCGKYHTPGYMSLEKKRCLMILAGELPVPKKRGNYILADSPKREYNRIHKWAERSLTKTGRCQDCHLIKRTHWSNKDHMYSSNPNDWQELCNRCHMAYDARTFGELRERRLANKHR